MICYSTDEDNVIWITYVLLGSCLAAVPPLFILHNDPTVGLPRQRFKSQSGSSGESVHSLSNSLGETSFLSIT